MSLAAAAWAPLDARATVALLDRAAASLAAESRGYTDGNLYHAARRLARVELRPLERPRFVAGPLAARLRRGALPRLLPPTVPRRERRLPPEWNAYFPAAILLVDRAAIVDLFAASGVLVQGRIAVVSVDGHPAHVVDWLQRGLRAGHRAPVGYLHDADTILYPFDREPLATWVRVARRERELPYVDLGLSPRGHLNGRRGGLRARELEEIVPWRLIARATRMLLALVPPDPLLAPLSGDGERLRRRGGPR